MWTARVLQYCLCACVSFSTLWSSGRTLRGSKRKWPSGWRTWIWSWLRWSIFLKWTPVPKCDNFRYTSVFHQMALVYQGCIETSKDLRALNGIWANLHMNHETTKGVVIWALLMNELQLGECKFPPRSPLLSCNMHTTHYIVYLHCTSTVLLA